MTAREMDEVARAMIAPGKGILAADESSPTIAKRFAAIDLESTEESRRAYRQLLFTAPGIGDHIGGAILYDESLRQATDDGEPFPEVLEKNGVIPGIKVDKGATPLAGFPGETVTEGLDGLRGRLEEYVDLGAKFAKWRAVIHIGANIPTPTGNDANAHGLARYAALCQEAGIVPIVEPEVLMDGDHSIERCDEVTSSVLQAVFDALFQHGVRLEAMVLKPNMVISGMDAADRAAPQEVAEATLQCLLRHVPPAVPGIAFLSGGQSEAEATHHLSLLNRLDDAPWQLSFSYGRALQASALKAWGGKAENVEAGQQAFLNRARLNGLARSGDYEPSMEG
ncbi:MAG TPA: class I fructose-bisphosphate aldolase [Actinomycetales bacterium]|nr:class I fructose-bisphosphate aldolase [Actinomycetales bacterium]